MAEAIDLVGLTDAQAETAVAMAGRGSMHDTMKMYGATSNAGYATLLNVKGPMAGMAAMVKSLSSMEEHSRQTIVILDQAVAAASHRAPEPSWRL